MRSVDFKDPALQRQFKVTIVGTPQSGKSSLLRTFKLLDDAFAGMPPSAGLVENEINLRTSTGVCRCLFRDYNLQDYLRLSKEQLSVVASTDCLLVVCDCLESSVKQAVKIAQHIQTMGRFHTFLIANKSDEYDPDMIKQATLNAYAAQIGAIAVMISVHQQLNLDHLQFVVADMLMNPNQTYGQICERAVINQAAKKKGKCASQ